jgi:hypothetical protein
MKIYRALFAQYICVMQWTVYHWVEEFHSGGASIVEDHSEYDHFMNGRRYALQ